MDGGIVLQEFAAPSLGTRPPGRTLATRFLHPSMVARGGQANPPAHCGRPLHQARECHFRTHRHHLAPFPTLPPCLHPPRTTRGPLHRCPRPLRSPVHHRRARPPLRVPARPDRTGRHSLGRSKPSGQGQNRTPLRHLPATPSHTPGLRENHRLRPRADLARFRIGPPEPHRLPHHRLLPRPGLRQSPPRTALRAPSLPRPNPGGPPSGSALGPPPQRRPPDRLPRPQLADQSLPAPHRDPHLSSPKPVLGSASPAPASTPPLARYPRKILPLTLSPFVPPTNLLLNFPRHSRGFFLRFSLRVLGCVIFHQGTAGSVSELAVCCRFPLGTKLGRGLC